MKEKGHLPETIDDEETEKVRGFDDWNSSKYRPLIGGIIVNSL